MENKYDLAKFMKVHFIFKPCITQNVKPVIVALGFPALAYTLQLIELHKHLSMCVKDGSVIFSISENTPVTSYLHCVLKISLTDA